MTTKQGTKCANCVRLQKDFDEVRGDLAIAIDIFQNGGRKAAGRMLDGRTHDELAWRSS